MQNTTNYAFRKPDLTDNYAIGDQNANWDSADTQIKSAQTAAAAAVAAGAATDTVIGNRTIDDTVTPSTGPNTITNLFSMLGKMIKAITGETGWTILPVTSIKALFTSKGAANGIATLDAGAQVPANQLGNVPAVNAASTTVRGTVKAAAVPSIVKEAQNVVLTTTGAQVLATFSPTVNGNFEIPIRFRVVGGTTSVTITISYTDGTGAVTDTVLNAQSCAPGPYNTVPWFIYAVAGAAITVTITASVANQVSASASIVGV
jgi:hypothetical protein